MATRRAVWPEEAWEAECSTEATYNPEALRKTAQLKEAQLKTAQKMHRATCLLCRKVCKRDIAVPAGMAAVEMGRRRLT